MTGDGTTIGYAAARWLGYLAAFLMVGAVVTRHLVLPRVAGAASERTRDPGTTSAIAALALAAGLILLAAHVARLYWQSRSLLDPADPLTAEFLGTVLGTAWGRGWLAQTASALAATLGWGLVRSRRRTGTWVAAAGAIGIAVSAPFTGHAIALPQAGRFGFVLDAVHFAAAASWLGSLGILIRVGLRGSPAGTARDLFAAFSPIALTAGVVAMAAGALMGFRYLGGLPALVTTSYGQMVLAKLAVLGGVAGFGAYNWRVVLPRLRADGDPSRLRRSARVEAVLGLALLAVTAVLVALPAPGEH